MPAADASSGAEHLAVHSPDGADRELPARPTLSNINVVRPLNRAPPVDPRTALNSKFSHALDLKLRRLKEKEVLETNQRHPVGPRLAMGVPAVSECNIAHAGLQHREKNCRSHPHPNGILSREKTKISPRADNSPSPGLKGRYRQADSEKPRFVTTVKTGQFLLPPPQVAYLLGLHTLYPPQERERIVYSYASKPKAVVTRPKRSPLEKKELKPVNGSVDAGAYQRKANPREALRGVRALIASVAGVRRALEEQDRLYFILKIHNLIIYIPRL